MSPPRLSLHGVIDGLINLSGASTQLAAIRSGVSPGTVAALRQQEPTQVVTWCRMASALGCSLQVHAKQRSWTLDMPRPAPPLMEREWRAWRRRRFVSALHSLRELHPRAKRAELEQRARLYGSNEEERLRERLQGVRKQVRTLIVREVVPGLRACVRQLCDQLSLTAEELALLAGVNLTAAQNALGEEHDGRLVILHRLVSALDARIRLVTSGGGAIELEPCGAGPWRPGDREDDEDLPERAMPPADPQRQLNRSTLSPDQILSLYDADHSIGEIARRAGISRQRVHKIAMDHGRRPRRELARERRIAEGMQLLS